MIYLILLIAAIFRLILINQSFWLDEGTSWQFSNLPIADLFNSIKGDFHPPLYYLILKPITQFISGPEGLIRLPGVLIGLLTVYFLYKFVIELTNNRKIAISAAFILAVNPLHIYYSQELRMYSLSTLFSLLSWRYLLQKKDKLFVLFSLLNLYTFYGSFFIFFSQLIYISFFRKEYIRKFIKSTLFLALGYLPWLPILFYQLRGGGYITSVLPQWGNLSGNISIKNLALIPVKFILGRISIDPPQVYLVISLVLILYLLLIITISLRKKTIPVFLWLIVPILTSIILSIRAPMLGYWRFLTVLPAFVTLIAVGINYLPEWASNLNLTIILTICILSNLFFWLTPRFQREDWRGLSNLIKSDQNSILVINFPGKFAPLYYYLPNTKVILSQSSLGKQKENLELELSSSINKDSTIYVLDYLSDLTDPDRKTMSIFNQLSFETERVYQFNNLGSIYELKAP